MELVTSDRLTRLEQPRVARRPAQAVAERQTAGHRRPTRQQPGHGMFAPLVVDDSLGQVHQAATFCVDRHPPVVRITQGRVKGDVAGEIRRVQLRESAAEHHARGPGRQSAVAQRAEEGDLGAGGFEALEVLGISEMERLVARHRDHRTLTTGVRFRRINRLLPYRFARRWGLTCDREDAVKVEVTRDDLPGGMDEVGPPAGLAGGDESQVSLGYREPRVAGQPAEDRQARRPLNGRRDSPAVPIAANAVGNEPRKVQIRVELPIAQGDRPGLRAILEASTTRTTGASRSLAAAAVLPASSS